MEELAGICQRAEHNYVGVKCGIMDQFASAMGKENHAIMLDCKTLEHRYIPLETREYKIIIANTNKKRSLGDSAYNERRSECEKALLELKPAFPEAEFLCDITPGGLCENIGLIKDENRKKRALHVIDENERVLKSAKVLENGDMGKFGRLMTESHESLRDKYEVSCPELDALVDAALEIEGTAGSRMTGAGFGGCTVSLVKAESVDEFIEKVGAGYETKTGLEAAFYISSAAAGGREVT
jgi:galactokinase